MDSGWLKIFALILLPTFIAAMNENQRMRDEVCYRICPNEVPFPSMILHGMPPLHCPGLQCPPPVCPPAVCPTDPLPHACPACPEQPSSSLGAPLWRALKNYGSTHLGYYKYYNNMNLDWFDAQMYCESEGAHLVILNSEAEDELIRTAMRPGWIHIGIHNLIPDGYYTTVLGRPVISTGFNKWLSGHLEWNVTNKCGFINKSKRGMGMGLCSDKGPFICEIGLGP